MKTEYFGVVLVSNVIKMIQWQKYRQQKHNYIAN